MRQSHLKLLLLSLVVLGIPIASNAQFGPIHQLRYNDDFSYLNQDTIVKKGTEKFKYIPLSKSGQATISFGGEIREWFELRHNSNFGDLPPGHVQDPNGVLQHRLMLHMDVHISKRLRVFTQLNNTLEFGNPNPQIPEIIEDGLGLHQAFVDLNIGQVGNENKNRIRLGRQEYDFGNGLVVSAREGPNNRLPFDGITYLQQGANYDLQVLAATPVIIHPHVFDNTHTQEAIWGAYSSFKKNKKNHLDLYYLGLYSERRAYNYQSGNQTRHTFGGRLWQHGQSLFYEAEMMYQTGKFNALNINAFNFTGEIRHVFTTLPWKPMVGLGASYVSGDYDNNDTQLNTYDPLYPKPVYGLAIPQGPSNIAHLRPTFGLQPIEKLFINFRWYWLSRTSTKDGTYTPGMTQVRPMPGATSDSYPIGTQYGLDIFFIANNNLSFLTFMSYVEAGKYIQATGAGKNVFFLATTIQYKF